MDRGKSLHGLMDLRLQSPSTICPAAEKCKTEGLRRVFRPIIMKKLLFSVASLALAATSTIAQKPITEAKPLRLSLKAYNEGANGKTTFQINRMDSRTPSAFLEVGDMIPGTRYRISKFINKSRRRHGTFGDDLDPSELVLVHTATGQTVVLIPNQTVAIPP